MQTLATWIIVLFLGLQALDLQAATPIGEALRNNQIRVTAKSKEGHSSVELQVSNLTKEPLTVDVFGALLEPSLTTAQRLGVPRMALERPETQWNLATNQIYTKVLPCFCLDRSRSSPRQGTVYRLVKQQVEPKTQEVFRYWNAHPKVSQGQIQSAVWNASLDHMRPEARVAVPADPRHRSLAVWNNVDYWLSGDGDLNAKNSDDPRAQTRQLARRVTTLLQTSKGIVTATASERGKQSIRLYDGTNWQDLGQLSFAPEASTTLASGEILFAAGCEVGRANATQYRLPFAIKTLSAGILNRQPVCLVQDVSDGVHHLDPKTGIVTAKFARYTDISITKQLFAYRTGQDLTWKTERQSQRSIHMGMPVSQMLADGNFIALITENKQCWRVDGQTPRAVGRLPENAVSWSLDADYQTLHVLLKDGRIQLVPLTGD